MGEWLTFTFALTGRREWGHGTQGVALGSGLVGLSARTGPQTRLFRTISIYLVFWIFPLTTRYNPPLQEFPCPIHLLIFSTLTHKL